MKTRSRPHSKPGQYSLRLDDQFCFALHSTVLAMNKVYRRALSGLGVTYSQYLVLLVLWETDKINVSAIGQRLFLDSATLTPLLKRLEVAELVTRSRAPADERNVIVALTQQGKNLGEQARQLPERLLEASGCTTEELLVLKSTLERLRTRFNQGDSVHEAKG